jgi:hypothetical protein
MTPSRSWGTCVLTSRVCDPVYIVVAQKGFTDRPPMLLPVAYKRFVDNVPKAIDEQLVLGIARGLQDALATGLGLDSHDAHERCAKLLAESPRIAEKREKLVARQKRLLAAQDELLDAFENTHVP